MAIRANSPAPVTLLTTVIDGKCGSNHSSCFPSLNVLGVSGETEPVTRVLSCPKIMREVTDCRWCGSSLVLATHR